MSLETGTQIGQLDPANPPGTDPVSQADDHLRLIKTCVQGSLGEMVEIWGIPTNDLPLKGLNAAGDAYVDMIKVDATDQVMISPAGGATEVGGTLGEVSTDAKFVSLGNTTTLPAGSGWAVYGSQPTGGATIFGKGVFNDLQLLNGAGSIALSIPTGTRNVVVSGALSKGSGSFRIDHPLKPETHELVHSFTESPQADLLYSGTSNLIDGAAEINLDEFHRMTEGTFVALNRNIRVFTTNETDWEPIRGSVTGNILSISCRDASCSDKVSWMVIGERQDQHMIDTDWTDEQGRVIVEPRKRVIENA